MHLQFDVDLGLHSRSQSADATIQAEVAQPQGSSRDVKELPHADVIERIRRPLRHNRFPVGFKGSTVKVWDMAG